MHITASHESLTGVANIIILYYANRQEKEHTDNVMANSRWVL